MPRERAASEVKEPHSISLKVLRLSRPSLAEQHSLPIDRLSVETPELEAISKASHAYPSHALDNPFILSPLLTLPPAFGSAYIGECFSCCLSANNEAPSTITSVRISAEMQTPSQTLTLELGGDERDMVDLETKESTQKIVRYDLKEEGNHILAVTVTYTEAPRKEKEPEKTEAEGKGEGERGPPTGRIRTFRKLYQFIAQQCLTVRTKTGPLPNGKAILEAQLENMGEGPISLEMVNLGTRKGWKATSLNWPGSSSTKATRDEVGGNSKTIPLLRSREIMQVAFLLQPIEEKTEEELPSTTSTPPPPPPPSSSTTTTATTTTPPSTEKVVLGQLSIEWRSACGDRGFLSTGRLGLHV